MARLLANVLPVLIHESRKKKKKKEEEEDHYSISHFKGYLEIK